MVSGDEKKMLNATVEFGPIDPEKRAELEKFLLFQQPWPAIIWEWFETKDDERTD